MAAIPMTRDPDAPKPTIEHQIAEVKREIALREQVYPGLIKSGKLKQSAADLHMDRIRAVLATLEYMRQHRAVIIVAVREDQAVQRAIETGGTDG